MRFNLQYVRHCYWPDREGCVDACREVVVGEEGGIVWEKVVGIDRVGLEGREKVRVGSEPALIAIKLLADISV